MKLREKWKKTWNFETKMHIVIVTTILVLTLVAIVVSTVSSVYSLTRQNLQYAEEQLATMALDYENNLNQYKAVVTSLVLDQHVQKYCGSKEPEKAYAEAGNVYSSLLNFLNFQFNANFIAITNSNIDTYVYNGNFTISESAFETVYDQDYESSIVAKENNTLRISFSNQYYRGKKYTLTLYFPAYSVTNMVSSNGMIIVNLNDNLLEGLKSVNLYNHSNLYFTDIEGGIISAPNTEQIGEQLIYAEKLVGEKGGFWNRGNLVNYQRIGNWNYYLINEIPSFYLYQGSLGTTLILLLVMLMVMSLTLTISRNMIKRMYRPISKIIYKMNDVSKGNLNTRIHTADMDRDSLKLAEGFNMMMNDIDALMERIKEEQKQVAQMQLNALQSQIQPHFLYNTLECIHWQAVSEGSEEISTMVKALAHYYRICLSEGRDLIPLERELEHVRNYMIIQNMRYDNIIEFVSTVPEAYYHLPIPKLTLQPLVENSIYHGIRIKDGRKGMIAISLKEEEQGVCLCVADNGEGMEADEIKRINAYISEFDRNIGYGINNVNKRIELLFGEGYGLRFRGNEERGLVVEIHLPATIEAVKTI